MMEKTNLISARMSRRLIAIADMLGENNEKDSLKVADVGCDHGYVSIYLIQSSLAASCIAMDVRKGPLEGAKRNISEYGFSDRISTRLSDGLKELEKGEANAAIIAGMGGKLMLRILEDGHPKELGIKKAVLQPQSDIDEFRQYLRTKGYLIEDERVIFDEGKYYFPMRVIFLPKKERNYISNLETAIGKIVSETGCDEETALRICNKYGECNIMRKDALLLEYLKHGIEVSSSIIKNLDKTGHEDRYKELETELSDAEIAVRYIK